MRGSVGRRVAALGCAVALLLGANLAWAFSYYEPVPQVGVGVARPTISQQLQLGRGESIESVAMWVDGVRVTATWNDTGLISYTPAQPLAPGTHRVRLRIDVATGMPGRYYEPFVEEFSFEVAQGALVSLPAPGSEQLQALARVNWYRKAAGLEPMVYAEALGASAGRHAEYLAVNDRQRLSDAHTEAEGTPLYFGTTGGDRARYFTYAGGSSEVINFVDRAEHAVDGWMDSLYHRIPLIRPGNTEFGYGVGGSGDELVNVVQVGPAAATPGTVLWPQPEQSGVPTGWDGAETPDPFDLYPGAARPVGYTITATFGGRVRSLTLDAASLAGPEGNVKVMRFAPGQDPRLTDTVAMIPAAPLHPSTTYSAYMAGQVDLGNGARPFEYRWRFTTGPEHPPFLKSRVTRWTGAGVVTSITLEGTGLLPGMKVFLGGLPVQDLTVASATRATFTPPDGYAGGKADLLLVTPGGQEYLWRSFYTGHETQRFESDRAAFQTVQLEVGGKPFDRPALRHVSGAVLLPEGALAALGAKVTRVEAIGRAYWSFGDRTGEYTRGHAVASVGGEALVLALPAQDWDGEVYLDQALVRQLSGASLTVGADRVSVNPAAVEGMTDIASHWARDSIVQLLRAGVVSGNGDGTYNPNGTLTRAAFVKMLTGARRLTPLPGDAGGFADTGSHWVAGQGYVGAAAAAGILKVGEYEGARFEPDRPITREEIAIMVTRALGRDSAAVLRSVPVVGGLASVGGKLFTDAGSWARPGHVAEAIDLGIVTGYAEPDGRYSFRPDRQATRAEAAVMIVRAMQR